MMSPPCPATGTVISGDIPEWPPKVTFLDGCNINKILNLLVFFPSPRLTDPDARRRIERWRQAKTSNWFKAYFSPCPQADGEG